MARRATRPGPTPEERDRLNDAVDAFDRLLGATDPEGGAVMYEPSTLRLSLALGAAEAIVRQLGLDDALLARALDVIESQVVMDKESCRVANAIRARLAPPA